MKALKYFVFLFVLTSAGVAYGQGRLSPQGGTITGTTAGNGLTGGGTGGNVTLNVGAAAGGGISVTADAIGLLTSCSNAQGLRWDGVSWGCISLPEYSSITMNTLMKGTGFAKIGNTAITEIANMLSVGTDKFVINEITGDTDIAGNTSIVGQLQVGGIATVSGELHMSSDVYMFTHQIHELADGTASTDAATLGQLTSAVGGAGGTINRVTKFTGANAVGDSLLSDDGTTLAYNSGGAVFSVLASNGNTGIGAAPIGSQRLLTVMDTTATTSTATAIVANRTGTVDATAGIRTAIGGSFTNTASRSAGSNNLTNIGLQTTATGAQVNIAFRTIDGDNYLNSTSGNTGVGFTSGASLTSKFNVNSSTFGTNAITSTSVGNSTFNGTSTPASRTSNLQAAFNQVLNGTFDTTSGALTAEAARISATATRSAGAGALTSVALRLSTTGAQANVALQTASGDNYLNDTSGNTGIGIGLGGTLTAGKLNVTNATSTQHGIVAIQSFTGGTTSGLAGVRSNNTSTFDTTGGAISAIGFSTVVTATRSAGSASLSNIGYFADVSGAQINIAVRTDNGDNYLNATSGATCIGCQSGGAMSASKFYISMAPSAATISNTVARVNTQGTSDATSGNISNIGFQSTISTTRSAGAFSVINTAASFSSSGGQTNRAIDAQNGDVLLNSTSGTTTIGFSQATQSALTVNGQASVLTNRGDANTFGATLNPTAATTSNIAAVRAQSQGTWDTTTGLLVSTAVYGSTTSTRSAGSNNLVNIGVQGSASGAQENRAVYGSTSGTGDSYGGRFETTSSGTLNIGARGGATGAGTVNIGLLGNASGGTTNIALRTDAGDNYLNATSGSSGVGYASGGALTGKLGVSNTTATLHGLVIAQAAALNTSNSIAGLKITNTSSFDTTGSGLTAIGIDSRISSTRGAGLNNLSNIAGYFDATGGQTNIAIRSNDGSNYFNTSSGNTAVGYASGVALPAKLAVTSADATADASGFIWAPVAGTTSAKSAIRATANGTFDTTAGVISSTGITAIVTSTRSAGANSLINRAGIFTASGAQDNRAIQTDDGNVLLNTVSGTTTIGSASTTTSTQLSVLGPTTMNYTGSSTGYALTVTGGSSGATGGLSVVYSGGNVVFTPRRAANFANTGTFDTTSSARTAQGINVSSSATRSAGANDLTNIAAQLSATNGQVNIALQTDSGDNILNNVSGSTFAKGVLYRGADTTAPSWTAGTGSPEGVVTAAVGSFYSRTDGGAGTSWYVKESGTGNTGWVAK